MWATLIETGFLELIIKKKMILIDSNLIECEQMFTAHTHYYSIKNCFIL